jgi:TolB-like protein/DNA-binding SARP family transcriptional activator/tetratricopeptide (TPR) repeat protein
MEARVAAGAATQMRSVRSNGTVERLSDPSEGIPPGLHMQMLGPLTVSRDGIAQPLPASRKVRALFAYLALAPRPMGRPRLCELLWDVADDPRGELRWCLSKLRGLVDDHSCRRVQTCDDAVTLDLSGCFVDVVEVDRATEAGIETLGPDRLRSLSALFVGEFVEGLEIDRSPAFYGWLVAQRRRFRACHAAILEQLVSSLPAGSDEVLEHLEQWLELAPFDQRAHTILLEELARRCRIDEGEEQVAAAARLFEAEGLDWAPIRDAWRAARNGQARVLLPGEAAPTSPQPPSGPVETGIPSAAVTAVLARPAVAILPFANLSGDAEQEYFADGMSEDLITALSHWRWVPVISRNSTLAYKGRAIDVTQIGRELNARYLLEGSVRRANDCVRIAAQLIDAETGHHLWAHTYDRRLGDVFELQDEITRTIVGAIEPQLSRAEQQRALRKRPENLDAWDLSLRALFHLRRGAKQDLAEAERLLTEAARMDSTASYTQSLIALCRFTDALGGWTRNPACALASTHAAAKEAVALDETDWLAHALLGIALLWTQRQYDRAIEEQERAFSLNPSGSLSHQFAGCVQSFAGQPAAAIPHLEAVLQLDPRYQTLASVLSDLGLAYFLLEDSEAALGWFDRAIAEQPDYVRAWQRKVACLARMDRMEEASATLARVLELQPDFSSAYVEATYPFRAPAHAEMFSDGLRKAGWRG